MARSTFWSFSAPSMDLLWQLSENEDISYICWDYTLAGVVKLKRQRKSTWKGFIGIRVNIQSKKTYIQKKYAYEQSDDLVSFDGFTDEQLIKKNFNTCERMKEIRNRSRLEQERYNLLRRQYRNALFKLYCNKCVCLGY